MKSSSYANITTLISHALHVFSIVVTPLIAGKYFIIAGIPASCSVLISPISLLIPCFLHQYNTLYARKVTQIGSIACLVAASILWVLDKVPTDSQSIVSSTIWQEVLGITPKIFVFWAILYYLVQRAVTWLYTKINTTYPILATIVATLFGGFIACSSVSLVYIGVWGSLDKVLIGNFFWFAIATICIGTILYMLKSIAKKAGLTNTAPTLLESLYIWFLTLFWVVLLLTNVVVVKCFSISTYPLTVGILTYPFTFVFTDIISELYGKTKAQYAIWGGFIASGGMFGVLILASSLPIYQNSPVHQQPFCQVFSLAPGMILASMTAYLIAQFTDIYLFDTISIYTKGRHLWLRNNVATMTSQLLDTIIFSLVLWIIWPMLSPIGSSIQLSTRYWHQLVLDEYVCKVAFALLDTPLVYGILSIIKSYKKISRKKPFKRFIQDT